MIGPRRAALFGLLLFAGLPASAGAARPLTPAAAEEVLGLLESAAQHGLEPEDYRVLALRADRESLRAAGSADPRWQAFVGRLRSQALVFGRDLATGRVTPEAAGLRWLLEPRLVDVAAAWERGVARGTPAAELLRLAPRHPEYHLLQSALERHLAAGGDPDLARRLALNLERWRWMPGRLGPTHARVNLPACELTLLEDGSETLRTRVIVGKRGWETPAFTDSLRRVMVNPYWNVPDVIARHEILPKLQRDPSYLRQRRYSVLDGWAVDATVLDPRSIDWRAVTAGSFPYRLRQEPGPGNALGRLIFLLGNDFEIYLHDTPGRRLFARTERALSHGCIRVEGARELADRLFAAEQREGELAAALSAGRNEILELRGEVPVHVVHFTIEPEGASLRQHPDLYGFDAQLDRALRSRSPRAATGQ